MLRNSLEWGVCQILLHNNKPRRMDGPVHVDHIIHRNSVQVVEAKDRKHLRQPFAETVGTDYLTEN